MMYQQQRPEIGYQMEDGQHLQEISSSDRSQRQSELEADEDSDQEQLAQQLLMQEQFAQYEQHLQQLNNGQDHHDHQNHPRQLQQNFTGDAGDDDELSQSDFLGSNQDEDQEGDDQSYRDEDGQQMADGGQHLQNGASQDGEELDEQMRMAYFRQRQDQLSVDQENEYDPEQQDVDGSNQSMLQEHHQDQEGADGEMIQSQMDTDRLRKLQERLIQNNNQHGFREDSDQSSPEKQNFEQQQHQHQEHDQQNNQQQWDMAMPNSQSRDLSHQIGNCDLSEIQPNTLTSTTGLLNTQNGFNSNLQSDGLMHLAASHPNNADHQQNAQFGQKTEQFQNVAQFLKQQREEERLQELQHPNNTQKREGVQILANRQDQMEECSEEDEEDGVGDDQEIQDMKAKFNQILANFDNENSGAKESDQRGQSNVANGSSQQTGYFRGGVPHELMAVNLNSGRGMNSNSAANDNAVIGSSSNELTMKAVGQASPTNHNNQQNDVIESFKRRNIERNLKADFKQDQQQQSQPQQAAKKVLVPQNIPDDTDHHQQEEQNQEFQDEEIQDFDDESEEDHHEHLLQDYENMGHVINLQIGAQGSQDFFFREQKQKNSSNQDSGKPPMPGRQIAQRRMTNTGQGATTTGGNGTTPERAGMARPPRINDNRYTGISNSTYGSHTTAASRSWTEKQKIAAQMRQNALQYGNSRRTFNQQKSSSGGNNVANNFGSRPRSSQQAKERSRKQTNSISHSHSERIFFPTNQNNESNQRSQRQLQQQRPQTAKHSSHFSKQRSQADVPPHAASSTDFYSHQPPSSIKPAFITSNTPRQQHHATIQEQSTNLVIQSSGAVNGTMMGVSGNANINNQGIQSRVMASSAAPPQAAQNRRPQTAKYQPYAQSLLKPSLTSARQSNMNNVGVKGVPPKKKNDPVSRYQSMQNEWAKNNFLKKTTGGNGRKLELDRFNQWRKLADDENKRISVKKGSTVAKNLAAQKNNKALGTDRRDQMRYDLRAKMSQKDYVDKSMKHFHYGKSSVSNGVITQNGVQSSSNGGGQTSQVQGGDVATQIAAAQHMLMLQQQHAHRVEEQQMAELAALKAEQQRMIMEHQERYEYD